MTSRCVLGVALSYPELPRVALFVRFTKTFPNVLATFASFKKNELRIDRPTDRPTDRKTDTASYRL